MKIGDVFVGVAVFVVICGVNLLSEYWFARRHFGRGAMRALLVRALEVAFFWAIGAAILFVWFKRAAV